MRRIISVVVLTSLLAFSHLTFATKISSWERLIEQRNFNEILTKTNQILTIDEYNQDATYYRAVALYKSRQREESRTLFNQIVAQYQLETNAISLYRYAMSYYYLGDNAQAITLLGKVVTQNRSRISAETHLGYAYAKLGQYQAAIKAYTNVIKHIQNHSIYYNRALAHIGEGQLKAAGKDMERSIQHKPEFHLPYFDLIAIYVALKQPQKALEWLETLLARKVSDLSRLQQDPDLKAFVASDAYIQTLKKYGVDF